MSTACSRPCARTSRASARVSGAVSMPGQTRKRGLPLIASFAYSERSWGRSRWLSMRSNAATRS
eukprot:6363515-Pyramimonas_sp.AAC.1